MLIKFKDFRINELKYDTYSSAARKLQKLGHYDRAQKLDFYSTISNTRFMGKFNMACNLVGEKGKHWKTKKPIDIIKISTFDKPIPGELHTKGPIEFYFNSMLGYPEEFMVEEFYTDKSTNIPIMVYFSNEEYGESVCVFVLDIKVEWVGEKFKVLDIPVEISGDGDLGDNTPLKFADRKSAVKFKQLLTEENLTKHVYGFENTREIFRFYSEAADWELFLSKLKNISANQLFVGK